MKLLSFMLIAFAVTSCQDDVVDIDELRAESLTNRVSTAKPTITGVYDYDTFMASDTPSPCVEAQMGQYLVVSGENLEGLTSLLFHGLDIESSEYYAQWDMVVMSVPYTLPESDASNSVTCTTKLGSVDYTIDLTIPDIEITGLVNEFQLPGEEANIVGKYMSLCKLDSDSSKVSLESADGTTYNQQLEVTSITNEAVTVSIPADAPDNSYINISYVVDDEPQAIKLHFRPTDCLLFGDQELTSNAGAVDGMTVSYTDGTGDGDPENLISKGLDGASDPIKYYRITGSRTATGWGKLIGITTSIVSQFNGTIENPENYNFVFEVNTKSDKSIPAGVTYKARFPYGDIFNIQSNGGDDSIDTEGEWVTMRMDLTSITGSILKDNTGSGTAATFDFAINYAATDADHSFANFRIEPKSLQ